MPGTTTTTTTAARLFLAAAALALARGGWPARGCTLRSPLEDAADAAGRLRFQASDGSELLSAVWAPGRDGLSGCSLSVEPRAVAAFLSRCRAAEGLPPLPGGSPLFLGLPEAKAACERGGGGGAGDAPRRRAKRGFTYPGTLWCGAGNIAESYEQLGAHQETDRCCREHDHCQHVIHPFTYKYGYHNFRWHTISHCACDNRLKACLRAVNDTASRVVGQAFFNVIQVPCFEFTYKEQCVEPYFYMWCKNYSTVAIAVVQEPVLYEYGGGLIDGPATHQPVSLSSTVAPIQPRVTPAAPAQKPGQGVLEPTTTSAPRAKPGQKNRKGKGKGRGKKRKKGKGLKRKKKGRKAGGLVLSLPTGEEATFPPKHLDPQELGKLDFQGPAQLLDLGEEDPFNAILSDEPAGVSPAEEAAQAESEELALPKMAPQRSKRKRERKGGRTHNRKSSSSQD